MSDVADELTRLVNEYRARASATVTSRLDVLMDLERVRHPGVVPFLLELLRDSLESDEVRIHVVKQLRNGTGVLVPANRPGVAVALSHVLTRASAEELRLQAALALGDFTDVDGVLSSLSAISLAADESLDLRYAAFTSLERSGPTAESVALLRQIAADEAFGNAARNVLSAWHVN